MNNELLEHKPDGVCLSNPIGLVAKEHPVETAVSFEQHVCNTQILADFVITVVLRVLVGDVCIAFFVLCVRYDEKPSVN